MSEKPGGSSHAETKWCVLEVTTAVWWVALGCAAGAQVSSPISALVSAGGFCCYFLTDFPLLVEGLFL